MMYCRSFVKLTWLSLLRLRSTIDVYPILLYHITMQVLAVVVIKDSFWCTLSFYTRNHEIKLEYVVNCHRSVNISFFMQFVSPLLVSTICNKKYLVLTFLHIHVTLGIVLVLWLPYTLLFISLICRFYRKYWSVILYLKIYLARSASLLTKWVMHIVAILFYFIFLIVWWYSEILDHYLFLRHKWGEGDHYSLYLFL